MLSLIKDSSVVLDKFYKSISSLEKMKKEVGDVKQRLGKIKTTTQTEITKRSMQSID